jgi:hypothetical protein
MGVVGGWGNVWDVWKAERKIRHAANIQNHEYGVTNEYEHPIRASAPPAKHPRDIRMLSRCFLVYWVPYGCVVDAVLHSGFAGCRSRATKLAAN